MFISPNQFCSPDLLAKIADVVDSAVIITRLGSSGQFDQRITYVNPAFAAVTGYEQNELLGRSIDVICDPRTGASKMLEFYNNCRSLQNFSLTIDSFKKQGSEIKLQLDVKPIVDNVQGAYYYIIMCKSFEAVVAQTNPAQSAYNVDSRVAPYPQPPVQQFAPKPAPQPQYQPQYQAPQPASVQPAPAPQPQLSAQELLNRELASKAAAFAAMQAPQPFPADEFEIPVAPVVTSQAPAQPQQPATTPAEIKTDARVAEYCKTQFLANMSHDLRTPLNAIIGFSEVIKDQLFGPIENNRYVSYASDIYRSGQDLLGTINEIMELSEIDPDREDLDEEKVNLTDTIELVLDVLSPKAFEADVKIIKTLDAKDIKLKGDRRKLKQVFAGVIGNAIKFSGKGSKIELSTAITEKGDFRMVVYAPTAQIIAAKTSLGSLLGSVGKRLDADYPEIALARKFVEAHAGKFTIFNSATSGTEINITLPAKRISIEPEKKSWLKVIS